VTLFSFEYFRCNIVRSTANSSFSFSIELKFCSEPKIANLHFHFVIQKRISKFKISMNNTMAVQNTLLPSKFDLRSTKLQVHVIAFYALEARSATSSSITLVVYKHFLHLQKSVRTQRCCYGVNCGGF
jgi:hypothetical protein